MNMMKHKLETTKHDFMLTALHTPEVYTIYRLVAQGC